MNKSLYHVIPPFRQDDMRHHEHHLNVPCFQSSLCFRMPANLCTMCQVFLRYSCTPIEGIRSAPSVFDDWLLLYITKVAQYSQHVPPLCSFTVVMFTLVLSRLISPTTAWPMLAFTALILRFNMRFFRVCFKGPKDLSTIYLMQNA